MINGGGNLSVSIIIPAYEEGHHIYRNLLVIDDEVGRFCDDYEIIVVDDGSSDTTAAEAKRAAAESSNIKVISCRTNGGKGQAIRLGFRCVSKELVTFLDADLDIPPKQVECLLKAMAEDPADVVIQSKRHPDSIVNGFPLKRKLLSRTYSLIIKALFRLPVGDTQVGAKMYHRDVLVKIMPKLLVKRYASDVEQLVLANKYGFSIMESPVHIDFNPSGDRMRMKDIFHIAWDTSAVFYRLNILKYYDRDEDEYYQHDELADVKVDHLT
ncbi:MAG: glycosyltransferase [Methanosarcinaceae archaeon]